MRNKLIIAAIALLFILLIVLELNQPKSIKWEPDYTSASKDPFGCEVMFSLLNSVFPSVDINPVSVTLYESLYLSPQGELSMLDSSFTSNYIIITDSFEPDQTDVEQLLKYVDKGNNVFIAASNFGYKIQDTLKFSLDYYFVFNDTLIGLNFTDTLLASNEDYNFQTFHRANYYFDKFNTDSSTVLGMNIGDRANFLQIEYGEGNFYLSSVPVAFTNYYLVNGINHTYAEKILSYLPVATVFWDEYYKPNNKAFGRKGDSPLRYVLSIEALRWAIYIGLSTLLLFIFFKSKRMQRIIPVIKPLSNTTLEFTKTVGNLYFQHGNHKDLAEKKITYFLSWLRTKLFLKDLTFSQATYQYISSKTGIPLNEIVRLFNTIEDINQKTSIHAEELMVLSRNIERFYKHFES